MNLVMFLSCRGSAPTASIIISSLPIASSQSIKNHFYDRRLKRGLSGRSSAMIYSLKHDQQGPPKSKKEGKGLNANHRSSQFHKVKSDKSTLPQTHIFKRVRIQTTRFDVNKETSLSMTRVPLTLVDAHSTDEQLPLAYIFKETLLLDDLRSSFESVVQNSFPILGGKIVHHPDDRTPSFCYGSGTDSVIMSFGHTTISLKEWMDRLCGSENDLVREGSWSLSWYKGEGHPILLPLFDSLHHANKSDQKSTALATVRITYPSSGGTILGVNLSHALADTSSCIRLVECWGHEMRILQSKRDRNIRTGTEGSKSDSIEYASQMHSNDRWQATCSGMVTPDHAQIMRLWETTRDQSTVSNASHRSIEASSPMSFLSKTLSTFMPTTWLDTQTPSEGAQDTEQLEHQQRDHSHQSHCYVQLPFPLEVKDAMKNFGEHYWRKDKNEYISTNDMLTGFGWLIKRELSGRIDWNISVVVNLRGRAGLDVKNFHSFEKGKSDKENGVFGNAITNIIAMMPSSPKNESSVPFTKEKMKVSTLPVLQATLDDVALAARAIRKALLSGLEEIPDQLTLSRMGKVITPRTGNDRAFSTTSWIQFPLWDSISFSKDDKLLGFYGLPIHPLPLNQDTYASVIVPTKSGGCMYNLLMPSHQADEARVFHRNLCVLFLEWEEERQKAHLEIRSSIS